MSDTFTTTFRAAMARGLTRGSELAALYVFHNSNPGDDFHGLVWC